VHYYNLHSANKTTNQINTSRLNKVVVEPIKIAGYLQQASLVMQISKHEMFYSRQHVWAEDLSTTFNKALMQDLNEEQALEPQFHFIDHRAIQSTLAETFITIKLEHFHTTNSSQVLAAGKYVILNKKDGLDNLKSSVNQSFYFELTLEKDGYGHAVEQLRKLINLLAEQINVDLVKLHKK
jgi:uncharacterized lipoprotein YmbA